MIMKSIVVTLVDIWLPAVMDAVYCLVSPQQPLSKQSSTNNTDESYEKATPLIEEP